MSFYFFNKMVSTVRAFLSTFPTFIALSQSPPWVTIIFYSDKFSHLFPHLAFTTCVLHCTACSLLSCGASYSSVSERWTKKIKRKNTYLRIFEIFWKEKFPFVTKGFFFFLFFNWINIWFSLVHIRGASCSALFAERWRQN